MSAPTRKRVQLQDLVGTILSPSDEEAAPMGLVDGTSKRRDGWSAALALHSLYSFLDPTRGILRQLGHSVALVEGQGSYPSTT